MPIREFTDARGVTWRVWSTTPAVGGRIGGVAATFTRGWLTFECAEGRRRLIPIPPEWEDAHLPELREMCERATPVGVTPNSGTWKIEKRD